MLNSSDSFRSLEARQTSCLLFVLALATSFIPLGRRPTGFRRYPRRRSAADPPKKVVIPFDFESKFDNGEYGQNIGEMLWTKLRRQGGFIIPETMQDVRDWCQRTRMIPGPDTPLPG